MANTNALETLDASRLPPGEVLGRYIDAPAWPWWAAGWVIGALFVLLFLLAWSYGRA